MLQWIVCDGHVMFSTCIVGHTGHAKVGLLSRAERAHTAISRTVWTLCPAAINLPLNLIITDVH